MSASAAVIQARSSAAPRGLAWVLIALGLSAVLHAADLPVWATLLVVAALAWRWTAAQRAWPLPPRWLRATIMVIVTFAVLSTFRTLNGIEAGTALLALMGAVKLLETRGPRDLTVIVFISYFLLFAALLRDQSLIRLPWLLATGFFATTALMQVHAGGVGGSSREMFRRTAGLLMQALPLAILLFLLFPRLPGPFWGLEAKSSARTGLNDEMTPGDVSDLSASGEVAFRVRFNGELPPPKDRYWRGPVLHEFDGRTWRRPRNSALPEQPPTPIGEPRDYQVTLEPHDRRWILALDLVTGWPESLAFRTYDFQLLALRPITSVSTFRLRSYPRYAVEGQLPLTIRRKDTALPVGSNPRSVALGRELAQQHSSPLDIADELLRRFREEDYFYTMEPPRLAQDPVDEFLFETRRGFCEHYAGAFTVVMRAAGIPARVVTGYQGGEFNPLGGYLIVRQSDAHAWSEIWVDRLGWVRVDPTAAVAPERIERGLSEALGDEEPVPGRLREDSALLMQATLAWDVVNDFWNERIVRFSAESQFSLLQRLGFDSPDWRTLGLALSASLAAFFIALTAYVGWRFRVPQRDWPDRLHRLVARRLRRRGLVRAASEGPVAFLDRAAVACPDLAPKLTEIRRLYVDLRYGPLPSERDLRRLKLLVNGLRA
jgi:transglutaminase-like putative cysteine protease